jgi:NADH:ubiquinone oxidoreductase subunit E
MNTIMVCIKRRFSGQPSCAARGSEALAAILETMIADAGADVRVHRFPCLGMCEVGPNMKVVGGDMYHHVDQARLPEILAEAAERVQGGTKNS